MTQTFLDIPGIIQDIIRRQVETVTTVVEDIYEGVQKVPMICVKGQDPDVEHKGKALDQYITPVTVACWHRSDSEADALRKEAVGVFTKDANYIQPLDGQGVSYGVNWITIEDYDSENIRSLRGKRYGRLFVLHVLWFLDY